MTFSSDALPHHLETLVPSEWGIWRWFVLRGAGFPAELARRLAQTPCAEQADALIVLDERLRLLLQTAIHALNETLDQLSLKGEDRYGKLFKNVLNARRRLADGKLPPAGGFSPEVSRILDDLTAAFREFEQAKSEWSKNFADSLMRQGETLREFAHEPKFQEAVIWQNRQAFETAVQSVARASGDSARNQRQRNHEELVASYLQRYALKNDTIGFFGPVAWGRIEPGGPVLELNYGPSLLAKRQTYFENWAIDKLAVSISLLKGMDWWIPPRLAPDVFIERETLQRPGSAPAPLSKLEQAVLPLCDGNAMPEDILRALHGDSRFHDCTLQEIREVFSVKAAEGILIWRFLVPVEVNAESGLRRQLLRIGNPELRNIALSHLDKIETARDRVGHAAGYPVQLNHALREMELVFEEITKAPGTRNPGVTYGGRTVLYEDCQRDLAIKLTPGILSPIVPALSLLLQSLRWFMQSTALEFDRLFKQTYQELATAKSSDVTLQEWWQYTEPKLLDAPSLGEIEKVFLQKWSDIISIAQNESAVQFESRTLQNKVEQLFPNPGAGYYPVRYFCPDIMLAAESAEAILRGKVLYVLGEVHSGKNTLCHAALVEQHPNRQELVEATQWDLSESCLKIINTLADETTMVRTSESLFRPADYFLATTADSVPPTGNDSHPISDLVLREQGEELEAVSRSNGRHFHILEAFSDLLFAFVMNKAKWVPPSRHVPRVLIDKLVVHRETWRFHRDELDFAKEKDEGQRFLGARKWMKTSGVPREMFVKSALEVKPFYVDMDSPVLVEILCRTVRRMTSASGAGEEIIFSEMLPGSKQLWLQDTEGAIYTSELRFAVVDLKARSYSRAPSV
jgi:hypothetical protein